MTLSEKHNIPTFTKWKHKDGGEYVVLAVETVDIQGLKLDTVVYTNVNSIYETKKYIRTVEHFKSSFTLMEEK